MENHKDPLPKAVCASSKASSRVSWLVVIVLRSHVLLHPHASSFVESGAWVLVLSRRPSLRVCLELYCILYILQLRFDEYLYEKGDQLKRGTNFRILLNGVSGGFLAIICCSKFLLP